MSLSHTKEWEYIEEVLIPLETESTVDITMSRMITQLFHLIGMNLLFSDKFEMLVTLGPLLEPKHLNFVTNLISPSPTHSQPYVFQMTLTVIPVHFVNLSANVQIH